MMPRSAAPFGTRATQGPVRALILSLALACGMAGDAPAAERGPVTNLPIPRFVSLKADEANVRRGPGTTHKIDWVFQRRGMPLQVTAEYANWRRVIDQDGAGGWVHYTLLSGVRTVVVIKDMSPLRVRPDGEAPVAAYSEAGVIARLEGCGKGWCRIDADGRRGWTEMAALWGVDPGADDSGTIATGQ